MFSKFLGSVFLGKPTSETPSETPSETASETTSPPLKMRLLNINTMRVELFPNAKNPEIPEYAMLSHRWGTREISYQEIQSGAAGLHDTDGYKKIKKCCEIASSVGFEYIWIDTCCIDKTNSVEHTDTLASMFHYYRNSQVSYTYLRDVPSSNEDPGAADSSFRKSVWFTRGWTLQELVAPLYVTFFDQDWNEIGTKSSLQKVISEITQISSQVLLTNYAGGISVAERMAWAKNRDTFMPEDKAYSLMGLLGVSMPMKYGEGINVTKGLEHEIEKLSGDSSKDPAKFDVSSWMVPESPYIFFIRKRPAGNPNIWQNEQAKWTITKDKEEIQLLFEDSGHSGTMMFKDKTGQKFAVSMGVHNYNVWCDIASDYEAEDVKKLAKEYWDDVRSTGRWNNLDRRTFPLSDGTSVTLAIRKGRREGQKAYLVDIAVPGDFYLHKIGPGCCFPDGW